MPDLSMSVTLTRAALGLSALQINDHIAYRCAPQFFGAARSWNRNQISSPVMDGSVTVSRTRQMVQETLAVEVFGRTADNPALDPAVLQTNMAALIAAFDQDAFTVTITIDGVVYAYACEAADVQVAAWTGPRMVARQGQLVFTMPRQPVALVGAV